MVQVGGGSGTGVTGITFTAAGSGYTSIPTCTILGGGGAGATCSLTYAGNLFTLGTVGPLTGVLFYNGAPVSGANPAGGCTLCISSGGVGYAVGTTLVAFANPPSVGSSSPAYLTTNPVDLSVPPTPPLQGNLGGTGSTNAGEGCVTTTPGYPPCPGTGPEDVIYGALQFYDAIATPTVVNFTATINSFSSITAPDGQTGANAKAVINYTNWEGQQLNIPPGCTITPNVPAIAGIGGIPAFVVTQVAGTSQFIVTVNSSAAALGPVSFPGVITSIVTFTKSGPCTGQGQPPLDSWDPVTLTLTVTSSLLITPPPAGFNITTLTATGLLQPYVADGIQLVANQTLVQNVGVTTAVSNGPINFTVQIVPGPNWVGPIAAAITVPTPTDIIYGVQGPTQINIPVTINSNIIAGFPQGVYTAFILFAPTPETPALPAPASLECFSSTSPVASGSISPACIPITITVGGNVLSDVPATVVFRGSSTPQDTSVVLANSTATSYSFTAGYVPNNFYCSPLPASNVFFVGTGQTLIPSNIGPPPQGTITPGGQFTLPLQINPAGLATGCYSGMVLFSNNGTISGTTPQTTVPVLVLVGPAASEDLPTNNGLALMYPPNSPFPTGGIGGCPQSTITPPNTQFLPCPPPGTQGTGSSTGAYPLVINVPAGMSPSQLANPTLIMVTGLNNTATTTFLVAAPAVSSTLPGVSIANPGGLFGSGNSSCSGANAPGSGTYASFSSLPLSPFGPPCSWEIYVDSTAVNSSNTVTGLAACANTGGVGITGTLTFNPTGASFPFSPLVVPLTVCISDSPNLNITQPVFYPNPTFGTGIPNPNFCGSSAFPVGCPQMIVGIPLPAAGVVLQQTRGNSTPACAEIGINTNGGGFSPLTGIQGVTIAPFTVPWLSAAVSTAPYLGSIPAFDSLGPLFINGGWGFDGGFGIEGGPGAIGQPIPVPVYYTAFGPGSNSSATNTIPGVDFAICTSGSPCSAINTVAPFPAGPATVNNAMQTLQLCANTDPLGLATGSFATMVTIGNVTFPVTFNISNAGTVTQPTPKFSEIGVYRPTSATQNSSMAFYLDSNGNNAWDATDKVRLFGVTGIPGLTLNDTPVAGDWDGSGVVRFGVFHCPSSPAVGPCTWFIDLNNNGMWDGVFGGDAAWANFGLAGDVPVVGDWTGDGKSKIGVMRCTPGSVNPCVWYLDMGNKHTYDPATVGILFLGAAGDQPAVGSWIPNNALPSNQIGVVHCPTVGASCTWSVDSTGRTGSANPTPIDVRPSVTTAGTFTAAGGYQAGDVAVMGNWNGNGSLRMGMFRSSTGQWYVDTNGNGVYDAGTDQIFSFGLPPAANPGGVADQPIVGFWTMP